MVNPTLAPRNEMTSCGDLRDMDPVAVRVYSFPRFANVARLKTTRLSEQDLEISREYIN